MPKFVPRERKHRRLAKNKSASSETVAAANEDVIIPASKQEKEARRQKLQDELRAQQPDSKISGKKRKRLDHYIDTKLRKEENLELIKKLAAQKVDTSLLQSSRKLGRVSESKREGIERALKEREAGLDVRGDQDAILFQRRKEALLESEDEQDDDGEKSLDGGVPDIPTSTAPAVPAPNPSLGLFGSGLKRPLDVGEDGKPAIPIRKRRRKVAPAKVEEPEESAGGTEGSEDEEREESDESGSEEWNGFDSEAEEKAASSDTSPEALDRGHDTSGSEDEDDGGDDEGDDEDDDNSEDEDAAQRPARSSAFKLWATEQRNEALGFQPSTAPTDDPAIRAAFKPRQASPDLSLPVVTTTVATSRPKSAITIPRSEGIQKARMELPVVQEEQKIMEAIHNNPIVVVCGATGSGKTTQVPQMMFESGYGAQIRSASVTAKSSPGFGRGMIGVTQPRRVAAVSVAQRVKDELGEEYGKRVAHQVRYDTTASRDTAIKFMTDGILLREIGQDFLLNKYSAIVIDEAHERSVNTDILIGMLSRIVNLREELSKEEPDKHYPLKLVIMSATLRVADFAQNHRLFRGANPPIVEAEGRQYPVTEHFSRRTERDFVAETVRKVERGHRKLPPGSMLVFLTGQQEIVAVAKRLKEALGGNTAGYARAPLKDKRNGDEMPLELDDLDTANTRRKGDYLEGEDSEEESDSEITGADADQEDAEFDVEPDPTMTSQSRSAGSQGVLKPHILPLYAALPTAQQMRVFQPPPEGSRMIVLATNVAETSLTIPGIRYVFDCGRSKEKRHDTSRGPGVQTFELGWISKASASQRSGRAGRTGPGHCYRLYSSAVYERFDEHADPEILRTPLESTVLQLKAMEIDNVVNFPFPTPPERKQLVAAEKLLTNLGAIEEKSGKITETGRDLLKFPVSPRFGKMLLLAQRNSIVQATIATVAALAVGEITIPEVQSASLDDEDEDEESLRWHRETGAAIQTQAQKLHQNYTRAQASLARWDDRSDAVKLLTTIAVHASASNVVECCKQFFLRQKEMQEAQQLRQQLHNLAGGDGISWNLALKLPSEKERKMLNQVVAAGFIDQIAIRADLLPSAAPSILRKPRRANEVPYRTLFSSDRLTPSESQALTPEQQELQRSVFVHSASVLAKLSVNEMPGYVVYSHLSRAAPAPDAASLPRSRMHPLTVLSAKQVASLAEGTPLLGFGKPIGKIEEMDGGKRRIAWVGLELREPGAVGVVGWPLGAWKVEQVRSGRGLWVVEKILAR